MDQVDFLPTLAPGIFVLALIGVVAFALWQGRVAWNEKDEERTRKRARRTYLCFLVCGVFLLVSMVVLSLAPDYFEILGIFVAPFVAIVGLVGLFQALMVWRVARVRSLLVLTLLVALTCVAFGDAPAAWQPGANVALVVMFS